MEIRPLEKMPEVKLVIPDTHADERGVFAELYHDGDLVKLDYREGLAQYLSPPVFTQDNCSVSKKWGTVRGLHFQVFPCAQAKLVMVVHGAIWDVVVDVRHNSSTFGRWTHVNLASDVFEWLYVPAGFAHGFCTLLADTRVAYKVTAPYSREHTRGLCWDDPDLDIKWPVTEDYAVVSDQDKRWPLLSELAHAGYTF